MRARIIRMRGLGGLGALAVALALGSCISTRTREAAFLFPEAEEEPDARSVADDRRSSRAGAGPDLGVEVSIRFAGGAPRYGELADATLTIGNGCLSPILLREVELVDQLPDPVAWVASFIGQLRVRKDKAIWLPRGLQETPPVFASGLLFPGEILEIVRPLRVRGPSVQAVVRYQEVPLEHVGREVLLPRLSGGDTFDGYSKVVFQPLNLSELTAYRKFRPGSSERVALVLEPHIWPFERRNFTVALSRADPEMPAALLEELGIAGAEVSYWNTGSAWILRLPGDDALLVYRDEAEPRRLPGVSFRVFDLADYCARENLPFLVDEGPAGDGEGDGEVVPRLPGDLLSLLLEARENGAVSARVEIAEPSGPERRAILVLR